MSDGPRTEAPSITVVVPTWRRPESLLACLRALEAQEHQADAIIVVFRLQDEATSALVERFPTINWVAAERPGQVEALNAGMARVTTKVVAITDDDTAPRPDWLGRIAAHFSATPEVGGVGGRDVVWHAGSAVEQPRRSEVGRVGLFGRVVGNHHLGIGDSRPVDVLKGANMSFRTVALAGVDFDPRLHGQGAQVHNDLSISLRLRSNGWALLYDPAVAVDHYPAERFDADKRTEFSSEAVRAEAFNETLTLLDYLPPGRQALYAGWCALVGTARNPGVAQLIRPSVRSSGLGKARLLATYSGRAQAARQYLRSRGVRRAPAADPAHG